MKIQATLKLDVTYDIHNLDPKEAAHKVAALLLDLTTRAASEGLMSGNSCDLEVDEWDACVETGEKSEKFS